MTWHCEGCGLPQHVEAHICECLACQVKNLKQDFALCEQNKRTAHARIMDLLADNQRMAKLADDYRRLIEVDAQGIKELEARIQKLTDAYESLRFYVDASDRELEERGITREDALREARDKEAALLK